jgi:hypothetical protein
MSQNSWQSASDRVVPIISASVFWLTQNPLFLFCYVGKNVFWFEVVGLFRLDKA